MRKLRDGDAAPPRTRRSMLAYGVGAMAAAIFGGCREDEVEAMLMRGTEGQSADGRAASEGRLVARPPGTVQSAPAGQHGLKLGSRRDGLLYVPAGYRRETPAPLALMLHGAGGNAHHGLSLLKSFADASGLILLAPDSRGDTWDVILDRYGPDVTFIDSALAQTFEHYNVDTKRLAIGGFSDGASYALSLGITNGDLFTHVIAFSPGFMVPTRQQGKPRLYVSHGTQDRVLPIDRCSRRIVPQVRRAGYDTTYREFDGPHTVPPDIAREAVKWFIDGRK